MTALQQRALLPAGLRDILPPEAAFEAGIREALAAAFAACGYDRVKPPLVEFEDGLTGGVGAAVAGDTFRLMDPVSRRMMGVRADMTTQVARIALARLGDAPRPLRLSYTGEVLRVRGTQLRPERQFAQVGAELIGAGGVAADIEIIEIAVESLRKIGIPRLSVDLTIPPLVPALLRRAELPDEGRTALRAALDRKDMAAVRQHGGFIADTLCRLMDGTGPGAEAIAALKGIALPAEAASEFDRLRSVLEGLRNRLSDLDVTIDPVENRGFEYHTGVSFTFFSRGERGELGSGGRYAASLDGAEGGEPATGFTLYVDTMLRVLPTPKISPRVFVPGAAGPGTASDLRRRGWVTIADLDGAADPEAEARRLGCGHIWRNGEVVEVGAETGA